MARSGRSGVRPRRTCVAVFLGMLLLAFAASASGLDGPPVADAFIDAGATNYGSLPVLRATASNVTGECAASWTAYLQWDVAALAEPGRQISAADLTLTAGFASFSQPVTLSVFPTDGAWDEMTVSGQDRPAIAGEALTAQTLTVPPAAGTPVSFPSTPQFVQYLNDASLSNGGSGLANLAVQITACSGSSRVDFHSREGTTPPRLRLSDPNTIGLSNFAAAGRSGAAGPLIAASGLIALLVAAGVALARRAKQAR